jgi:CRISPR-associated endonuclease/helicase Cas3
METNLSCHSSPGLDDAHLRRWPPVLDEIWAKSAAVPGGAAVSLPVHTWQALERLQDVRRLRPRLPEIAGLPSLWKVLYWAAFLHDWGKVARGFQIMVRSGPRWGHRHEVLSVGFIDWLGRGMTQMERTLAARAILSHHCDPDQLARLYPTAMEPDDLAVKNLIAELPQDLTLPLRTWLLQTCETWPQLLGFAEAVIPGEHLSPNSCEGDRKPCASAVREHLAGYFAAAGTACSLRLPADLTLGLERPDIAGMVLRGTTLQVDHCASAGVGRLPSLAVPAAPMPLSIGDLSQGLYQHQIDSGAVLGSAILVSPTASGKTEAALLWASRQCRGTRPPSKLLYTLPYQASMNAMFTRLCEGSESRPAPFPGQVGLLHGRSVLAAYRRFVEQDSHAGQAGRMARAASALARLFYYPVSVLSPYQMLKATYRLKGYEALLCEFADAMFVMDEIHAYEPERLAMILETLRYLKTHFGAEFFVMSATLPPMVREMLMESLDRPAQIAADKALFAQFARHRLHLVSGDLLSAGGVADVLSAYTQGKAVLVVLNTVRRAQEFASLIRDALRDMGRATGADDIILVHSRFTARDRLTKERLILAATGVDNPRQQPIIVVATQVVEVSLNIDLDVLFSDPAPLEALIQRFGRVNRKFSQATGAWRPRLAEAPVYVFREPSDGSGVYGGAYVERALGILEGMDEDLVDEAKVDALLGAVYSGALLDEWIGRYEGVSIEFRKTFIKTLKPFACDDSLASTFDQLFDGCEVLPADLRQEYDELKEEEPLRAAELLVPISWRRLAIARKQGLVEDRGGSWPKVVLMPYSSEVGLRSP